jgi:SnoaL-like protein
MQAPSGQMTAPPVQDLLTAGALAGEWVLDPRKSSIRLRSGSLWGRARLDCFVQTTHPGTIQLDGDTASGRAYICELVRFRGGRSERNHGIYHDRYRRTPDGWKFAERVYEVRYLDTTPLAGSAPTPP